MVPRHGHDGTYNLMTLHVNNWAVFNTNCPASEPFPFLAEEKFFFAQRKICTYLQWVNWLYCFCKVLCFSSSNGLLFLLRTSAHHCNRCSCFLKLWMVTAEPELLTYFKRNIPTDQLSELVQ